MRTTANGKAGQFATAQRGAPLAKPRDRAPQSSYPLGAYVEAVKTGSLLFLSGMLPVKDGKPQYIGRLGKELDGEAGRDALQTATLNALSAAKEHVGSLDRVTKVIRVGVDLATSGDSITSPSLRTQHRSFFAVYLERTRCLCGPFWG